jgi:hypothetical protein
VPFRPPLTLASLQSIQAANPDSEDVRTLLWEIKRMRSMLLRAEQLRDRFPKPGNCLDGVWDEFQRDLAAEPCVLEREAWKGELLGPAKRKVGPQ